MAKRKDIMEPIPVRDLVDLEDLTLEQVQERVEAFAAATGCDVDKVKIQGDWDGSLYLYGLRPPTEKEIAQRTAAAERTAERSRKIREKKEAAERAEFARLYAKYGGEITK